MELIYKDQLNSYFSVSTAQTRHTDAHSGSIHTYKIIHNYGGALKLNIDLEFYILQTNQIAFINPGSYISIEEVSDDKHYIIDFNSEFYCLDLHDKDLSCNGLLFGALNEVPLLNLESSEKESLSMIISDMKNELNEEDSSKGDMLRLLLKRLIIICVRIGKKQLLLDPDAQKEETDMVRMFMALVEKHFKQKHKVADYADLMYKSPKTLSNTFKKLKGLTPLQIIQERIVLDAKRQMFYTDKNIKEICYDLGFSEPAQFSRLFKNVTGKSPSEFQVMPF